MDRRIKEAVRYLGYGKCAVDEVTLQLIQESFEELEKLAEPKFIYRIFETSFPDEGILLIGKLLIQSKSLQKNLMDCEQAVMLGTTLGIAVDRQIRKYELVDMARAVVLQACAAAYLEEYCDEIQEKIEKMFAEECYLRPRFSPGYGDFSIMHQRDILHMLEASKCIGLTMTEGYMLTPTKSVTAIIGISKRSELC